MPGAERSAAKTYINANELEKFDGRMSPVSAAYVASLNSARTMIDGDLVAHKVFNHFNARFFDGSAPVLRLL